MYEVILVPLDGSKRAERILPHVEELAKRYEAKVFFLQVIESVFKYVGPYGLGSGISVEDTKIREEEALSYLASWQGEFREKGIKATISVEHGPIVEKIISVAERENADLIAIASHGRGGLSRVFYGSVAAGVLHRVDRPLLLVRSD